MAALEHAVNDSHKEFDSIAEQVGIIFQYVLPVKQNHQFNSDRVLEGAQYVNPLHFPAILPNSIPGYLAIRKGFKGVNSTICMGEASLAYSFDTAMYEFENGTVSHVFIGGSNEASDELLLSMKSLGKYSAYDGWYPGEGACFCLVEQMDVSQPKADNSKVYAEIAGFSCGFDDTINKHGVHSDRLEALIKSCLDKAGVSDVDAVIISGFGANNIEKSEATAIKNVFNGRQLYICNTKRLTGECFGASQLFQIVCASCVYKENVLPTAALVDFSSEIDSFANLDYKSFDHVNINNILITSINCFGQMSAVLLKRP